MQTAQCAGSLNNVCQPKEQHTAISWLDMHHHVRVATWDLFEASGLLMMILAGAVRVDMY